MPTFALDCFQQEAEAFARARAARTWAHVAGLRPGLGLATLYGEDFPAFTSRELYVDVVGAPIDAAPRKPDLDRFTARAVLEGRTRDLAGPIARQEASATVQIGAQPVAWRELPERWSRVANTERRHELASAWRSELTTGLSPGLERWREALLAEVRGLDAPSPEALFGPPDDLDALAERARSFLALSAGTYRHVLGIYFGQLGLPLDDAWEADADWAFRAPALDHAFPTNRLMPAAMATFKALGIDVRDQPELRFDFEERPIRRPGAHGVVLNVPDEVAVSLRVTGGYLDYARLLGAIGEAQHALQTDRSLAFAERWLGDPSTTVGYGLLLASPTRERVWLEHHLGFEASQDYRVIASLGALYQARRAAALLLYERRLWDPEAYGLAAAWEEELQGALAVRPFGADHLRPVLGAPWSASRGATRFRASLFAAQVRAYLQREFDERWFEHPRAGRFLVGELWRTGRRFDARQVLGFMGDDDFDENVLWNELAEVLETV